jgi:hypothetical protein
METNIDFKTKDLSYEETKQISGGELGDLLYYISWTIGFYITTELNILKTGYDMAKSVVKAMDYAWKECPVSVEEWN